MTSWPPFLSPDAHAIERPSALVPGGRVAAGQKLIAHIAQFIRVRDGKIEEIKTYDCYEPFA